MDDVARDADSTAGVKWDVVDAGHAGPGWRQRWAASSSVVRLLLAVAAIAAIAAVVVASVAADATPRRRTVTVVSTPAVVPATPDANGCPVGVQCVQRAVSPAVVRAVAAAFPTSDERSSAATVDASTLRVYRATVVVAQAGISSVVVALQCVPGAARVTSSVRRAAQTYDKLNGNQGIISRTLVVVVPGATPGCSTSIELETVSTSPDLDGRVLRLAADPAVLAS